MSGPTPGATLDPDELALLEEERDHLLRSLEDLERLRLLREAVVRERSSPHRIRDLAVDGNDLIAAGFAPGPELGRALTALLEDVIKEPELNTKDELMRRARELLA